jgi:hypothetical protein
VPHLGLPQSEHSGPGVRDRAAPAIGPLARLKQDTGAEPPSRLSRRRNFGHLNLGQPEWPRCLALNDPTTLDATETEGQVAARGGSPDPLCAPAAEALKERSRPLRIAGMEL